MRYAGIVLFLAMIQVTCVHASDIARSVRSAEAGPDNSNGGYFEIGAVAVLGNEARENNDNKDGDDYGSYFGPSIGGAYRYRGWFIEAAEGSFDGLNIGFTLWHNDTWVVDFLAGSMAGIVNERDDDKIRPDDTEQERNEKILDRDTFYNGAGLRVSAYLGDHIFQTRLVRDTHGGNGVTASFRMGRHWQVRNWNLHGILGASYHSAKTNQYWWGITAEDASEKFPTYSPDSSVSFEAEFGAAYPLSENWVFRTFIRHITFPSAIRESPLARKDFGAAYVASVSYVF